MDDHRATARTALRRARTAPAQARAFVRSELCPAHGGGCVETVELLASELVTNAVLHAGTPVGLVLVCNRDQLVLGVTDAAPVLPRRRAAGPDDEHGRGLQVVEALCASWGARLAEDGDPAGKSVWCTLDVDPRPSAAQERHQP